MARVVYDFYMTQAAHALEIACDSRKEKIVPSKSPLKLQVKINTCNMMMKHWKPDIEIQKTGKLLLMAAE